MKTFADASFVIALYRQSRFSAAALKLVQRGGLKLFVSSVTRLEVVRSLVRDASTEPLLLFRQHLAEQVGIAVSDIRSFSEAFQLAEQFSDRIGSKLKTGATDILVVSLATLSGATHLCSFDQESHQREVALMAGLQVIPNATKTEKSTARRL